MIVIAPQLLMFTGTGATKSLTSEPNDAEARLLMNALPNASQVPGGNTPAPVRSIAVSPNCRAGTGLMWLGEPGKSGSVTESRLLTAPIESVPLRISWLPQQGSLLLEKHWLVGPLVTQNSSPRVGFPPPLVKS